MDRLQVSMAYLLLRMAVEPSVVMADCPTCPEGYFMVKNCSGGEGIRCQPCTNCSAINQLTLSLCTAVSDSVCGNQTSTTSAAAAVTAAEAVTAVGRPVSAPETWIVVISVSVSVFTVLLLSLFLMALMCRKHQSDKSRGKEIQPLTSEKACLPCGSPEHTPEHTFAACLCLP